MRRAACTLALAATLLMALLASVAGAEDVGAYADRVRQARDAATAADADGMTRREASDLAARLNSLLPATERVEMGDGLVVGVDNSIMRSLVARLDAAPNTAARADVLEDLVGHLDSLVLAIGEPGAAVPEDPAALAELLDVQRSQDRSSLTRLFGDLVDRLAEWLQGWWGGVGGSRQAGRVFTVVIVALIALLVVALAAVAVRAYLRARAGLATPVPGGETTGGAPVVAAAEELPLDARGWAGELADQGRYRDAVRALFGGAARMLVELGYVAQARTRTNGELLREVEPVTPGAHGHLAVLCRLFEGAWYGHVDPGPEGYASALELFDAVSVALSSGRTGAGDLA